MGSASHRESLSLSLSSLHPAHFICCLTQREGEKLMTEKETSVKLDPESTVSPSAVSISD